MNRTSNNKIWIHSAVLALVLGMLTVGTSGARANEQDGGAPGDWLSNYAAARTMGIGGAFVAVADEPIGAVWNPACLTRVYQNTIHIETARYFEGTTINGLSFATPERRLLPGFGLTVLSLRSGEFERTNELNDPMGTFREGEMAFLLSASKGISRRFSLGANLKIIRQSIDEFNASGVGADLGLLFSIVPSVMIGASVLNIGGPNLTLRETPEIYPAEFRGGIALRFLSGRAMVTSDINYNADTGARIHAGSEFWIHPTMAMRLGYCDQYVAGGVSVNFAQGIRLDYGMMDHFLGVIHRVGISYRFGGFYADSEAIPPVFSPLGTESVTKFHLEARTKAEAVSWSLDIVDKSNRIVRSFSGNGRPPAHVMWDGKDETGLSLADGVYRYRLVVTDVAGQETVGRERSVEIITSGPQGDVPVIISNGK
ncbi:MAG: PorV/PorQ family protein [bacterium]|nr:MAG: PorV/PorQ family protein [bacterium]